MPQMQPPSLVRLMLNNRFLILLAALFLLLVVASLAPARQSAGRVITGLLFIAMLVTSVLAVSQSRRSVILAVVMAAPALVAWSGGLVAPGKAVGFAAEATGAFFITYVIVVILRHVFSVERVSVNVIAASLCVYLLLGVLFAEIYGAMLAGDPESFTAPVTSGSGHEHRASMLYFSLVTLTTLGYGDAVPMTQPARALAALEAMMGQIYLAVLVARLVALHIAQRGEAATEGEPGSGPGV